MSLIGTVWFVQNFRWYFALEPASEPSQQQTSDGYDNDKGGQGDQSSDEFVPRVHGQSLMRVLRDSNRSRPRGVCGVATGN